MIIPIAEKTRNARRTCARLHHIKLHLKAGFDRGHLTRASSPVGGAGIEESREPITAPHMPAQNIDAYPSDALATRRAAQFREQELVELARAKNGFSHD